jgi:hypothetical protein
LSDERGKKVENFLSFKIEKIEEGTEFGKTGEKNTQ